MDKIIVNGLEIETENPGQVSDGYHTFDELYDHRCLLFINLCLLKRASAFWRPDYEGWFCLYLQDLTGQISYHIPDKYLPLIEKKIMRYDEARWDGHTSNDVIQRLIETASNQ